MTFVDFFAGIGGVRLGLEQAGHKCVGWCEFDKYAQKSYRAIHNTEGEWFASDVRSVQPYGIPAADGWCFGFPCFARDTYILTEKGYIPIQDVKVGDLVFTHKKNWKPVTSVMQRDNADLWLVKGFGILPTITTAEHPYFMYCNGSYDFIKVKDIKADMQTTLAMPQSTSDDMHTTAYWWILGRYVADGWTLQRKDRPRGGRVVIACGIGKDALLQSQLAAAGYHFTLDKFSKSCTKYIICCNALYEDVQQFGHGASNKRIPRCVLELPIDKLKAFYDGYMSGDGVSGKQETTLTSPMLALGLQIVAYKLGYTYPAIYANKTKPVGIIEGRVVNQKPTFTIRSSRSNRSYRSDRHPEQFVSRTCELPTDLHTQGTVYNISVQDDESYVANGAFVHNCQDISIAGQQRGLRNGKRSGLFFEIMRLLAGRQERDKPCWLLVENVKALLSIGNGFDFLRVLSEMDRVGYVCEWQVLNSKDFGVPQNRERVFIVGHLRGRSAGEVFPIQCSTGENSNRVETLAVGTGQGNRVLSPEGLACTQVANGGGQGGKTGLYAIKFHSPERGLGKRAGSLKIDVNRDGIANCLTRPHCDNYTSDGTNGVLVAPVLTPDRIHKRQNGRRMKDYGEPSFTLTAQDQHGVAINNHDQIRVRRLTPRECWRLQGFPDEYFDRAVRAGVSDSQLYKQAGNAVTVNVARAIGERLWVS